MFMDSELLILISNLIINYPYQALNFFFLKNLFFSDYQILTLSIILQYFLFPFFLFQAMIYIKINLNLDLNSQICIYQDLVNKFVKFHILLLKYTLLSFDFISISTLRKVLLKLKIDCNLVLICKVQAFLKKQGFYQ
jgi:hypothetical protein